MRFFISRFFTLFNDIIFSCAPRNNFFFIRDYWHWASEMWQGLRVKPFPNRSNCQHMRHCISLRWAISARCSPLIRLTAVMLKRFEHTLCKASILWNLDQHNRLWIQVQPMCNPRKSKCKKGVKVSFGTARGCNVSAWHNFNKNLKQK